MKIRKAKDIEQLLADDRLIQKALAKGVREALHRHELAGLPVAQWRNGKVVWVSPRRPRAVKSRT